MLWAQTLTPDKTILLRGSYILQQLNLPSVADIRLTISFRIAAAPNKAD